MKLKNITRLLLGFLGFGGILAAIFAYQIGLDKNSTWGSSRTALFGLGLAAILLAIRAWIVRFVSPFLKWTGKFWKTRFRYPLQQFMERFKSGGVYQTASSVLVKVRSISAVQKLLRVKDPFLIVIVLTGIISFYL
jgi:membrane protease YdiL (CAAX protease family)